MTSERRLLT